MSQAWTTVLTLCVSLGLAGPAVAQTANSSGGAGSATQATGGATAPQSGNTASGAANGQNSQASSGGAAAGSFKIGAPTPVEQQEQQKSEQDTHICKGC